MRGSLAAWVKRHQLAAYCILAYAITWLLVAPLVTDGLHLTTSRLPAIWHALGALGPVTAAFIVTALVAGRGGVRRLLASMGRWRVGAAWFLAAALSPFALLVLSLVALRVVGLSWPDLGALGATFGDTAWLLGVFIAPAVYGLGEEPGWRGFALPRLQKRRSALGAASVLAVFWGLWHAPFFTYRYQGFSAVTLVFFFLGLLAGSIWLACLYNATGGSVLMCMLWHVGWNMVNAVASALAPSTVAFTVQALLTAEVMIAAVVIVLVWKPANLSPREKRTIEEPPPPLRRTAPLYATRPEGWPAATP